MGETHSTRDMCFPGGGGTGMCISGRGTLILFLLLGIVPGWEKSITLGICVCRVGEHINTCDLQLTIYSR